jgi:small subunit ribosomal protein S6
VRLVVVASAALGIRHRRRRRLRGEVEAHVGVGWGRFRACEHRWGHRDDDDHGGGAGSQARDVSPSDATASHVSDEASGAEILPAEGRPLKWSAVLAREYEMVLMLDPEAPDKRRDEIADGARKRIESTGELKHADSWGVRKMAYEIRQRNEADYRFYRFVAESPVLADLDHTLKITDGVLRFRIFKVDAATPVIVPPPAMQPARAGRDARRPRRGRGGGEESADEAKTAAEVEPEPSAPAEPAPAAPEAEAPAPEGEQPETASEESGEPAEG